MQQLTALERRTAISLALVGFLSTVALARYVLRRAQAGEKGEE